MKFLLPFLISFFLFQMAIAQSCLPDGITFTTQLEIDDFPTNYPGCTDIGGFVKIGNYSPSSAGIINLDGLSQITHMGSLSIRETGLTNLVGLNYLANLDGALILAENPKLQSILGLSNLVELGGSFSIYKNPKIKNFNGLGNLTKVSKMRVEYNDLLESFDGLEHLVDVGNNITGQGLISIQENKVLTNLMGLKNIDPHTMGSIYHDWFDLTIRDNPKLTECAIDNFCEFLSYSNNEVDIKNNGTGCSSKDEFDCGSYGLSGVAFFDTNENGIYDAGEKRIQNLWLYIEPQNEYILTDWDGYFFIDAQEGVEYTITEHSGVQLFLTTDNPSYTVTYTPGLSSNNHIDFGYRFIPVGTDGNVNLTSNKPKCNSDVSFFLKVEYTGSELVKGSAFIRYDKKASFVNAIPYPDNIDSDHGRLYWDIDTMFSSQPKDFEVIMHLPEESSWGQHLFFWGSFYATTLSSSPVNYYMDSCTYLPVVLCSLDPNDKVVSPSGLHGGHYTLHNQKLTYTVHFQNIGTTEAENIFILDTIDSDLDIKTMRVINSSFPVRTSLKDHIVSFLFKDINLADSTSNEPASHGFVMYEISPKANLADFTVIENTAHIIFDNNSAIVTNTVFNTMVTKIPTGIDEVPEEWIQIQPNPTSGQIQIALPVAYYGQSIVCIFNQLGEQVAFAKTLNLDVSDLPKGIYFVKVEYGDKTGVAKMVIN